MYQRILKLNLPRKQSAFLWGARKTGKSTYLKNHFPHSVCYDLLHSDLYVRFSKHPNLFRQKILTLTPEQLQYPIIVDEVQRVPELLNEIHWLIENSEAYFILCGSSARSLHRKGVNLLGGRAWRFNLYPLVYPEFERFNLLQILNQGTIPSHYDSPDYNASLAAYVDDYLTQEIHAEGLVRHLPNFALFLDCIGLMNGQQVNHTNIARDVGINVKTVREYFQILIDTLLGYYVYPYRKRKKRELITQMPKFYLFDVGVANYIGRAIIPALKGEYAGRSLEHLIFLELIAYRSYMKKRFDIHYWRTKTGLEVDFIVDGIPIEVKISETVHKSDIKGLHAFCEEHSPQKAYVISLDPHPRQIDDHILILPCEEFLRRLWAGEIIG